ncbi:hypothetical protein E1B28_009056 [Marasmius oreades]|uniref:Uncharacterized protein n=1 Tax=Marasmius oreades TaxID=181124 RepID=A0A9P7RZU1_9AGAR|nr:uncharacterized protein E1B28_009056 [Marasmius oreades]KAG7092727.1 hypothetical protein E1B28_009056 [Marasmius oreades]
MFEPVRWAAKYGWRSFSPLEVHVSFLFWVEIGKRMGIKDIPNSVEEFQHWEKDYEDNYMVPARTNVETGMWTVDGFFLVPEAFGIKNLFRKGFFTITEDRIRVAMMQPEQPKWIFTLFDSALRFMACYARYLRLPATSAYYSQVQAKLPQFTDGDEPVMTPCFFMSKPWYKPKSSYLWDWLMVKIGIHDSMPGSALRSEGYRLDTIGPSKYERDGQEEIFQMAEKMLGCPIEGAWRTPLEELDRLNSKKIKH